MAALAPGAGGPAGPARRAGRRPGRDRLAELGPAAHLVLRRLRLGTGAGADQLPAVRGRDRLHRRAQRRLGRLSPTRRCATSCSALDVAHKFVLGDDDDLYARGRASPREWAEPDENATATINYTSGTTARPKGVQLTHRNLWLNATVFGLHTTISDRDVLLHTLPMFHGNGWGMPYGGHRGRRQAHRAAPGRRHRDPAPGRPPRRHADVRGAGRGQRRARRRRPVGRRRSPAATGSASSCAGRPAALAHDRAGADRARLGVHPDLRAHRDLAAAHGQPHARRVGRAGTGTSGPAGWAAPGRPRSACGWRSTPTARCSAPSNHNLDGYWKQPEETAGGHSAATGSTPATAATSTTTATW